MKTELFNNIEILKRQGCNQFKIRRERNQSLKVCDLKKHFHGVVQRRQTVTEGGLGERQREMHQVSRDYIPLEVRSSFH